jgi:hypothetical protein
LKKEGAGARGRGRAAAAGDGRGHGEATDANPDSAGTGLQPEVVPDLTMLATLINEAHGRAIEGVRQSLEGARQVGLLLVEAKGKVARGEFQAWVEANCAFSYSTAAAYMRVVRKGAALERLTAAKLQSAGQLTLAWALQALATPRAAGVAGPARALEDLRQAPGGVADAGGLGGHHDVGPPPARGDSPEEPAGQDVGGGAVEPEPERDAPQAASREPGPAEPIEETGPGPEADAGAEGGRVAPSPGSGPGLRPTEAAGEPHEPTLTATPLLWPGVEDAAEAGALNRARGHLQEALSVLRRCLRTRSDDRWGAMQSWKALKAYRERFAEALLAVSPQALVDCDACGGRGAVHDIRPCPGCGGTGVRVLP